MRLVNTKMHTNVNFHSLDVGDCFSVPHFPDELFIKVTQHHDSVHNAVNLKTGELLEFDITKMTIKRDDVFITKERE